MTADASAPDPANASPDASAVEQARSLFLQGVDRFEQGRPDEAEACFAASLQALPGRPSTLINLGAARLALGRAEDALAALDEALRHDPARADGWLKRGQVLRVLQRHDEALPCFERAVQLDPSSAEAWSQLGQLRRDAGDAPGAAQAFRRALEQGADPQMHRWFLAALGEAPAPEAPPRAYVQTLFDEYAADFEVHVQALGYHAPALLMQQAAVLRPEGFQRALDLGCGSGLCGREARALSAAVDGVDLSAEMLALARATGAYDDLVQADLAEHLRATGRRYDLVVAADVFIYVGALQPVFEGVARVLRPGGLFCFSVERADEGHDLQLRPSLRYAHSERLLRSLAEAHGLRVAALEAGPLRQDQDGVIPGWYAWLRRG